MATKVILPVMGEGVTDATITKWLKQVGDQVSEYDPLVEVNTDKVDTEVPSPVSGTVLKIVPEEGSLVEVETILAWVGEPGEKIPEGNGAPDAEKKKAKKEEAKPAPAAATPKPIPAAAATPTPIPAVAQPQAARAASISNAAPVSPLVARIAADHNVNLSQVPGSGAGGRITKQDVLDFVASGGAIQVAQAASSTSLPKYDGVNMTTFLSPVVKQMAIEHNLDVSRIQGTGKEGRVTKNDIEALLANGGQAAIPLVPAATVKKKVFPQAFPDAIPGQVMKLNPDPLLSIWCVARAPHRM
jgi:2-oxoglutarate dehydrogenase E2 component (dihydrolipoamide succinyltransferase)